MQAPHLEGARIVRLDERLARADIGAHEWHEPLTFVAPPAGAPPSSNCAASLAATLPHACLRPWAPAHLRVLADDSGDIAISWIRRARIGGDAWGPGEPPLGAPSEAYVVEILDGDEIVRIETVSVPSFLYSVTDQTADGSAHVCGVFYADSDAAPGSNVGLVQSQTALLDSRNATPITIDAPTDRDWQCSLKLFFELTNYKSSVLRQR